jgi:hypothetical protein
VPNRTHALRQKRLLDYLVDMCGKCCASAISTRRRRRNSSTPASNATIAVRGMKRTLNEIACKKKLHEAAAGRQRRLCREATAAVLRRGSPFLDHSSVCRAPGNWNSAAAARPTGLPIRILQLSPAAHLYLSSDDAVSRISASRSRAFGVLIVERESVCK